MSDTAPPGGVAEQVSPEKWSQPVDRTEKDLEAEVSSRSASKKHSLAVKHRDSDTSAMKSPYTQPVVPPVAGARASMPSMAIGKETAQSSANAEEPLQAVDVALTPEGSQGGEDADTGAKSEPDAQSATR